MDSSNPKPPVVSIPLVVSLAAESCNKESSLEGLIQLHPADRLPLRNRCRRETDMREVGFPIGSFGSSTDGCNRKTIWLLFENGRGAASLVTTFYSSMKQSARVSEVIQIQSFYLTNFVSFQLISEDLLDRHSRVNRSRLAPFRRRTPAIHGSLLRLHSRGQTGPKSLLSGDDSLVQKEVAGVDSVAAGPTGPTLGFRQKS
jgi:hypothetical protein